MEEQTKNKEETKTQMPIKIGNIHMMFYIKYHEQSVATIKNIIRNKIQNARNYLRELDRELMSLMEV